MSQEENLETPPAEPVDPGTLPSQPPQRRAEKSEIILAPPVAGQTGIRESNAEAMLSVLRYGSQQLRDVMQLWARGIDQDKERTDARLDKAQEQLLQQAVANVRLDERLRGNQQASGWQLFAASLGGAILGYGLGKLESGSVGSGIVFSLLGLALTFYGCWPTVSLRR